MYFAWQDRIAESDQDRTRGFTKERTSIAERVGERDILCVGEKECKTETDNGARLEMKEARGL